MAERSLPSALKTSLVNEDVHTYLHLVKFEKPKSAAESQFVAGKATDYAYITDAPYNVSFDDGSKDSKDNSNGSQNYVANKLLSVGTINETTEAKASGMNIELSGTALGTIISTNATFTSTTITTDTDLLDAGFQEGDVILLEGTGFANDGKYVRIDKFTNSNQTITVTGIDCVVTADSTSRAYTFSFASEEIQAILTSKEATNYVNYINREVIIHKAHINPETGVIIGTPFVIFRGIISKASVKDNVLQKSRVMWNLTSHWGDFIRVQGRVTSDYAHRALSVTGVSDKDALLRPEYEFDAGFAHAEKSINVLSTYQTMETRYKMKKRGGLAGLIGLKKVVEYQVEVDREVDLQFNLTARYLPVVYGVQRVDSIPIFADISSANTNHVYVAHAICEGEIGGIYDVYIDENSSVCLDLNDFNARSSTSSNAAVLCNGRADKGDVLAGASGRTNTVVNFLEDGEAPSFGRSPGGFNSVFRQPQSGTSFNSAGAQGLQHESTFTFQSPITTNLFIHTGKSHQDADDTLVNQAKLKRFKIQNELSGADKNNYWSPNHRLLDTAYVVGKYIIAEGDTTIPKLEFVVRGKKIRSYNYDFSYDEDTTKSNAAHTNFTLGTSVTLHHTADGTGFSADDQIGSAVTIIDKWGFHKNTSAVHYRFRFSANPQDGVSTQFYMKDGSGNKWHMITYDHEDQPTLVNLGTPVTANVTAIGAYNSGSGTSGTRTITISANLPFHSQTSAGQFVCFNFSGVTTTEAFRVVSTSTLNSTITINDNGRGLDSIKQLLDAGNTCTLRNMNMVVLNASAAPSVNDAYNGRKIVITRFDTDDTILKQEERTIVDYATASSPLPKIASIDVPMPFDFSPEATDFYVIKSGEDEEDIRVSINPAIQLLDYLKDKKHGKGLDDSDIDLASFLSAARDCETRSDVTVQVVGDVTGSLAVGDVYEYAPSSVVKFRGTVKSRETKVVNITADNGSVTATTFTQVIFNNVIGKLLYKWTNWRTFADNDYYWNKGLLYLKSGSGTVTSEPTSGHITTNITLSKVSGSGGSTLTVSIQDGYTSSGNPVIKKFTNIVEGFNSPGYSLYDSDDVKYWIYLGWDEPEQRFVTRHQMNQIIDTSVPIFDNINSMLKQFNGVLRYANGKYGLAIKQAAPTSFETYQTITDDDIIGEINVQDGGQKSSFNSMAANVIDPQNKFNARSITYFNSDYLKQDKGIRRSGNFAMPGVSNYFNSRINIQQFLDESRYGLDISFTIDQKGLLLLTGEIIRVTNSRLGFTNKLFRISNLNFMSNCLVQVNAVEHNDSAYFVGNIKTASVAKDIEDTGGTVNETVVATPDSPSGLTATTNGKGAIDLSWSNSSSFTLATHMTEVFASSTNDRSNATSIFNTQATTMSHIITAQSLTEKYYWVRHSVVAENGQIVNSDFHPTSSTGGVLGSATGAIDGATGARGPGRWHIQVSSLPTTSALANSRWNDGTGSQPTTAVVGDQAFFFTGTLSNPTGQKVWIYAGSNNWTEQVEVIDGDLLVQGTVTADAMNVSTLSSMTANIGDVTAGTIKGGNVPDANAAPSGSETGAFMDLTNGKMVFGNASKHILFDGTNLQLSGVTIDANSVVNSTAGVIVQEDASQEASAATTLNFTTGLNVAVTGSAPSQTATVSLDSGFATLASPTFTGTPLAPTATAGTNTDQLATTAFVGTAVSNLVDSAPSNLDTLNELAAALNDDNSFSTTVTNSLAAKAPLASPALTGTPTAPTATAGTNTTQIATTAFVQTAASGSSGTTYTTSIPSSTTKLRLSGSDGTTDDIEFVGSGATTVTRTNDSKFTISSSQFSHPTHDGDDIDIDTTALTGATVISDLDFNITTDTLGHVTDANGTVATRNLTLANLGYTGATDANNYTHPNHSGDVTSSGDGATTIAADAVTNTKLANMAVNTVKGRITSGTGDPEDLTAANLRTIINVEDGSQAVTQANLNAVTGNFGTLSAEVANIGTLNTSLLDSDIIMTRDIRVGPSQSGAATVGASTAAGSMAAGKTYVITSLGNTDNDTWSNLAGTPTNQFAASGYLQGGFVEYEVGDFITISTANSSAGTGTGVEVSGEGAHLNSDGDFLLGKVSTNKFMYFDSGIAELTLGEIKVKEINNMVLKEGTNQSAGLAINPNTTPRNKGVLVGYGANGQGYGNTSVGNSAGAGVGFNNTSYASNGTASHNTCIGDSAGLNRISGKKNVFIGAYVARQSPSLGSTVTMSGDKNIGIGGHSDSDEVGSSLTVFSQLTSGSNNISIGSTSGAALTTASNNTFLGTSAGQTITTGGNNICINSFGGTTGTNNIFIKGGGSMTTGSKNVIIGGFGGNSGGLDLRTSSNNVLLSDGDGNVRLYVNSSGTLTIGTTSTTPGFANTNGHAFHVGDASHISRDQGVALVINRGTNEGEVVQVRSAGTHAGGLGIQGSDITIGNDNVGLRLGYAGLQNIVPVDHDNNDLEDNLISLGHANSRFHDIFSGGTIQLHGDNKIATTSGDLTLDVVGGITLDSDGGQVDFKDNGTLKGLIDFTGNNLEIQSRVTDGDILLRGQDGSSFITAATFDMSNEGFLTLNDGISINASSFMMAGTLMFTGTGNMAFVDNRQLFFGSSLDMTIKHNSSTGNNEILTNSDLLLDSATDIKLDAGGGDISLLDDGTEFGHLSNSSGDFLLQTAVNDKDLIIKGVDNNSVITALTFDMSEAGAATFNNNITAFSDRRLKDNIKTLDSQKTYQMRGVSYTRDGVPGSGVIAQELEEVAPELVLTNDDGIKSVDYGRTVGYLIETIKDLKKEVEGLKDDIASLRK